MRQCWVQIQAPAVYFATCVCTMNDKWLLGQVCRTKIEQKLHKVALIALYFPLHFNKFKIFTLPKTLWLYFSIEQILPHFHIKFYDMFCFALFIVVWDVFQLNFEINILARYPKRLATPVLDEWFWITYCHHALDPWKVCVNISVDTIVIGSGTTNSIAYNSNNSGISCTSFQYQWATRVSL